MIGEGMLRMIGTGKRKMKLKLVFELYCDVLYNTLH
jgi:hypothetical protein